MKAHTMRLHSTLALCLAMVPAIGLSQLKTDSNGFQFADTGSALNKPWTSFHLSKTTKVKLNFKNAGVDSVLQFFMDKTGVTILHDPTFKDPLTIASATSVTLDRALDILNTVIGLRGFQIQQTDGMLVIKPKDQGRGPGGGGGQDPTGGFQIDPSIFNPPKPILKTYPIKWANASEVARLINDVFTQSGNNQNPFQNLINQFQQGRQGRQGQRGPQAISFVGNPVGGGGATSGNSVRASSDDYSNTVTVNAVLADQGQVENIIKQIDKQTDTPVLPKVFKLQYANANDIASVVQNVLTVNAPKGRGGTGNQQQNVGQQFGLALARGGAAAFGNVVADVRTNSLIVSTTVENLALVDQVIKDLDRPTEIQDTTFVFPLQNANATTVGQLLQSAFGTRQGAGAGGSQTPSRAAPQTPNVNATASKGTTSSGGGARPGAENLNGADQQANAISEDQKNLLLALQDPNADAGELLTSIAVQGGFGGGGGNRGGGGGGGQRGGFGGLGGLGGGQIGSSATTSTDPNGRVVGTNDLTGQITVIPDINTNSLIIVGPPNSVPILKRILDQLDKVPEQVMIDVVIVEANLGAEDKFGLEFKFANLKIGGNPNSNGTGSTNFGQQTSTTPLQGFSYALTGNDLSGFFNMLKTDTKFDVLSTPKIFTTNNIQASINISQSIPYVLSTIQDAATGSLSYNYAFENVGIVLTVTPRITAGGNVDLSIDQTANDLAGYTSFNAPIVNQREANTEVQVADGKTVILGGIIQRTVSSTVNKVPLLGDLPLLGNLFRSSDKTVNKTELLIFLTPHLVKTPEDADKLKDQAIKNASPVTQGNIKEVFKPKVSVPADGKVKTPPPVKTTDSHGSSSSAGGTTIGDNS